MNDKLPDNIRQVAQLLGRAQRVCCMTGAGVSAESGVATFRGPHGLWEGRRSEDVATPEAFDANPDMVWRFYQQRRELLLERSPNPGHFALVELANRLPQFVLITQNIDGLHRLAGSEAPIELHGNIWINRCNRVEWSRRDEACPDAPADRERFTSEIPTCEQCGTKMRPAVVWFGETLPADAMEAACRAVHECEIMLVVGTSSLVQPAAGLSMLASNAGAVVVEINPEDTPLSPRADYCLRGKSGAVLPALIEQMESDSGKNHR